MIRILHAADLHLDSPFSSMRPDQAAARRSEQRELLFRLVRQCNDMNCDLLLLAGDLFDSRLVYRETIEAVQKALRQCRARVFIAPGNHDPYTAGSPYAAADWPENVHVFSSREITEVRLENPRVRIFGGAFTEARSPARIQGFRASPSGCPSVLVVHGELTNSPSAYLPVSEADVRSSGLDYLALGHIHAAEVRRIGNTTVGTPGCALGRGFDETGEKGALYVELEDNECRTRFIPLGGRQYQITTVQIREDPLRDILQALPAHPADDICRIILTGSCPPPRLDSLQAALADRFYGLELVDQTQPPVDLWAAADEDSLKGGFVRTLKRVYDQTEHEDRAVAALAAEIGLALMDGREVPEC